MKSKWKLPKSNGQACSGKLPLAFILALDGVKPDVRYHPTKKVFRFWLAF